MRCELCFRHYKDNIRIVILNDCYSKVQAEVITSIIDCAIGMNSAITDDAAITFVSSFYRAIGFGRSVQEAFNQAKVALLLEEIPEENVPELLVKPGIDASKIILINGKESEEAVQTVNPPRKYFQLVWAAIAGLALIIGGIADAFGAFEGMKGWLSPPPAAVIQDELAMTNTPIVTDLPTQIIQNPALTESSNITTGVITISSDVAPSAAIDTPAANINCTCWCMMLRSR